MKNRCRTGRCNRPTRCAVGRRRHTACAGYNRQGVVLVLVLIVIAMLALAGLAFSDLMLAERKGSQNEGRQIQARAAAESGLEAARHLVSSENARRFLGQDAEAQDTSLDWHDNSERFHGVLVADDESPRDRSRFTVLAPRFEDRAAVGTRYGLEDESARLNLRTILQADQAEKDGARRLLMNLPGMTESIADAILDWIDSDDTAREFGAETQYYSSLAPGYAPRNAPPVTLDELLLVRDVTPQMLYGPEGNRAAPLDANPPANTQIEGVDNSDGSMNRGWSAYLTLYSAEQNLRPDGQAKINLNQSDLQKLYEDLNSALGAAEATFIIAYRQNGPYSGNTPGMPAGAMNLDLSKPGGTSLSSPLDLIGARTQVTVAGEKQPTVLQSPFSEDRAAMSTYLPKLMENATTQSGKTIQGRVNINLAPRVVLMCIPGITAEKADQIIARRGEDPRQADASHRNETWLLAEGIVTLAEMKKLMPWVTAGGCVYRAQAVGYFEGGGPSVRLEAVFDAGKRPADILFWRDASIPRPAVESR